MQTIIHTILFGIPILSAAYWIWAHRQFRKLRTPRAWRLGLGAAMLLLSSGYGWILLNRADHLPAAHAWLYAIVLLWGIVALPFLAVPMMASLSLLAGAKTVSRRIAGTNKEKKEEFPPSPASPVPGEAMTRRQALGAAATALPVIATFGAATVGIPQNKRFRVRDITVHLPDLPPRLDGLRIAHLSDTHVGKFTRGAVLDDIARVTNELEADLVLHTGDLIDHSLSDLPEALDMIERIDRRSGLFLVEGNHDLFEGVEPFVQGVRERGVPLLRDESQVIEVRSTPVEIMGISWSRSDESMAERVDRVANRRDPDAFPILLAHHPHAFDPAAERGIPLTLAGHTHGGQLMVTPGIGPGPMLFRYWSGLYRQDNLAAVVSNGTGNWFPLRTAAPAEILHLVLRRA